ncbi:MAG: hypothetical protein ABIR37_04960 [Candidatus Saccharimonadales bacterium]
MRSNQKGFAHLLLLVFLVAVVAVGFAAYRVRSAQTSSSTTKASSTSTLTSSSKELDAADSQLDSSLDDSALNSDLDSM